MEQDSKERASGAPLLASDIEVLLQKHRHALTSELEEIISTKLQSVTDRLETLMASHHVERSSSLKPRPRPQEVIASRSMFFSSSSEREERRPTRKSTQASSLPSALRSTTSKSTRTYLRGKTNMDEALNEDFEHFEAAKRRSEELGMMKATRMSGSALSLTSLALTLQSLRGCLKRWAGSSAFELFWIVVIMANAIFLGAQVELNAQDPFNDTPLGFTAVSAVFTVLFLVELLLRLAVSDGLRSFFLHSENRAWHWFDVLVVVSSLLDSLLSFLALIGDTATGSVISNVRCIRLLRIARVMRAVRILKVVRQIGPLRALIQSIVATFRSLVWAIILLTTVIYVFGIVFCDAATGYFQDQSNVDDKVAKYFFGLQQSMITLYFTALGGVSTILVMEVLEQISYGWAYLYLFFCSICVFCLLNVMTGFFCQSAMSSIEQDREFVISLLLQDKQQIVESIRRLFEAIDTDNVGGISIQTFESALEDKWFRSFFQTLELEPSDAWTLFKLLDRDGDGAVDAQEFVDGCLMLRGHAKAIDIAAVKWEAKWIRVRMAELRAAVEDITLSVSENLAPSSRAKSPRKETKGLVHSDPELSQDDSGPIAVKAIPAVPVQFRA